MRALVVCESPPTIDPGQANGSTLILAEVLPRLPADIEVDLVWFADRAAEPSEAVRRRCRTMTRLPLRPTALAAAALPLTHLPRATWQRSGGDDAIRARARVADVVYLHGLHTFSAAQRLRRPLVAHEVDPWSSYWAQRAADGTGVKRVYDRLQSARARRLEASTSAVAARYVVVNASDAAGLSQQLGRPVVAVPNGVDLSHFSPRDPAGVAADLLAFVGTLDYSPNVAAVRELALEVLPLVRARRPLARLVVAGRRPVAEVRALAGPTVEIIGEVPDVRDVYARASVTVYPGQLGRGTKNTVLEALAVGSPVVCSPEAARALPLGEHARLGRSPQELADLVVDLLNSPEELSRASAAAVRTAQTFLGWDEVAHRYGELLRDAVRAPAPQG